MLAGVEAGDDRVDDARGAVDDVQRWVEALLDYLARGEIGWILIGDQPVSTLFMWMPSPW